MRDGEASGDEAEAARRHLTRCASCRAWAASIERLDQVTVLRVAEAVPDLTGPIMASVRLRRDRVSVALRVGLGLVAAVLVALSARCLLAGSAPGHSSHHLAVWDAAFAVGLVVVAARPERARGLMPVAVALVAFMIAANLLDNPDEVGGTMSVTSHLLEATAAVMLWALGRRPVATPPGSGPVGPPWGGRRSARWEVLVPVTLLVFGVVLVATTPRPAEGRPDPVPVDTHLHGR